MPDIDEQRSPAIPAPTRPAITFRGRAITPQHILDLFKEGKRARQQSRRRILACRRFRRKEPSSLVKVSPKWARQNPEAAAVATLTIEERITLERNLIAAGGAVEPFFEREPTGFLDTDREDAEFCQAYMNEWLKRCVPVPSYFGKGVEDGEWAQVVLPCDLDMEGSPDYFDFIDAAAYDDLDDDGKQQHRRDENDRKGRYVKLGKDGKPAPKARYRAILDEPDEDKARPAAERERKRDMRHKAAQQQHDEDVAQYILRKQLDSCAVRLIPALDCAPVFKRGRRRNRWELVALVERTLYEPWEILDAKDGYRYVGMGDRAMIPQAYREDGAPVPASETGSGGQVFVYTAYVSSKQQDRDGTFRIHPLICTTIGGAGTWDDASGTENDPNSVSIIDLYDEYGIEGTEGGLYPFVTYHGGLRLEDDDPDHYWQPYLWALMDRLKAIESMTGAIRATVGKIAFTGHVEQVDPRWAATEEGTEFLLETDGNLRRTRVPQPGEVEIANGPVTPFQQAQVGQDAWRLLQMDREALLQATAIDQIPGGTGQSGAALLTQATLGQVGKRHIREGVQGAVVAAGEAKLRIDYGIYEKYGIRWPIRTVQERPIKGEAREGRAPALFDPAWVKDGQFSLAASYPQEENLAKIDQEANLAERGFGNSDRVYAAMGEQNADNARLKADRDRLLKLPQADLLRLQRIARKMGNKELEQIVKLQQQQLMSPVDVPGVPGGIPMASLSRRPGQPSGQNSATQSRAGQIGGALQGAETANDARVALEGAA